MVSVSGLSVSHDIVWSGFQGMQSVGPFCFHESGAET